MGISTLRAVPGWIGSTLSDGGYGLAIAISMTFVVAAYEDDAGFGSGHASAVFALTGVCITGGGILLGRWSDSVGRRAAMTWTYVGMTAAILLVPVGAEPWAVFSAVVFGLALSGAPAVPAAHLADWLDPRRFAAAFGAVTPRLRAGPVGGSSARRVDRRPHGHLLDGVRGRRRGRSGLPSRPRRCPAAEPPPDPARLRPRCPDRARESADPVSVDRELLSCRLQRQR